MGKPRLHLAALMSELFQGELCSSFPLDSVFANPPGLDGRLHSSCYLSGMDLASLANK